MGPARTMICVYRCEDTPVSLTPKSRYEALSSEAIQTISSKTDVYTTRSPMLFWSSSPEWCSMVHEPRERRVLAHLLPHKLCSITNHSSSIQQRKRRFTALVPCSTFSAQSTSPSAPRFQACVPWCLSRARIWACAYFVREGLIDRLAGGTG